MEIYIVNRYSTGSKIFHWLIAVIVICLLSLSFFLSDVPERWQGLAYTIHKSLGLTVLFLTCGRIYWIYHRGRPALPGIIPKWELYLSRAVQYSLYIFLLVMPLSGWIMSVAANHVPTFFGLFNMPLPITPNKLLAEQMDTIHKIIAWILIGLLSLHIIGALKHYFWDRDEVLRSMM